ncbi:uncharacterized protein LOC126831631 [Patella vulgata]|uniref:uncharacterized protein LOC126831631 n=1 Tax=Patella vulgata TaxID=6465 RepID=UPI0024A8466B|nr:uncharacterized protein LOC126831631 [Patella vulgata]
MLRSGGSYIWLFCLLLQGYRSQNITTEEPGSPVVGCDASLIWTLDKPNYKTSIRKVNHGELYNSKKYRIHKKLDGKQILRIRKVTFADAGLYRCQIGSTHEYKDINLTITDFRWKNDIYTRPVAFGGNVTIMWKYFSKKVARKIWLYRQNNIEQNLAFWNKDFKTISYTDERMTIHLINDGDGTNIVKLIVRGITMDDTKYKYMIKLQFNDDCYKYEKPLNLMDKQVLLHMYSETAVIKALPQESVHFVWYYKYIYPVYMILFTRTNDTNHRINFGYWLNGTFHSTSYSDGKLFMFNISIRNVANGIEGKITLTLHNASIDDFNYTYVCRIIFPDDQQSSRYITLKGKSHAYNFALLN